MDWVFLRWLPFHLLHRRSPGVSFKVVGITVAVLLWTDFSIDYVCYRAKIPVEKWW